MADRSKQPDSDKLPTHYVDWTMDSDSSFDRFVAPFLVPMIELGGKPYRHEGGLMWGCVIKEREALVVHRGMQKRWLIELIESGHKIAGVTLLRSNLSTAGVIAATWLTGGSSRLATQQLDALIEQFSNENGDTQLHRGV